MTICGVVEMLSSEGERVPAAGGLWMTSDRLYPPELSDLRRGFRFAFALAFFKRVSLRRMRRHTGDVGRNLDCTTSTV